MNKALLATLAATTLLGGCNQGPPAPDKTIQQLMAEDVQPTAEVYWNAVGHVSELVDGEVVERDFRPETEADWQRTRDAATRMVELANLLTEPGYTEGRGEDWMQFSNSLTKVARLAEQAADSRDPEQVFEVGGTMYSVCSACHQVYPPAEGLPDDAPIGDPPA